MTKVFGSFSFVSSCVTNIAEQFIWIHKLLHQLLWILWEHFFKTKRLLKIESFEKKGKLSTEKIILAHLFPLYRTRKVSGNHL